MDTTQEATERCVRVYAYSCRPLTAESKALADRQIELAAEFRDRLIRHEMICRNHGIVQTKEDRLRCTREDRAAFVSRGLWYGSYWLAEEAAAQACRKRRRGTDGRFSERGSGMDDGRLGAGIQTRELVSSGPDGAFGPKITWASGKFPVVTLSCGKDRATSWTVKLHRALPAGRIVRVVVVRRRTSSLARVGPARYDYSIQFTVRVESPVVAPRSGLRAAIDIGWWSESDTLRVYDLVDEVGFHERKLLPERLVSKHFHTHSIEAIRDEGRGNLKMRTVVNRAYDDAQAEARRKQIAHLDTWAISQERHVVRARSEHYRIVARDLCSRYAEIYIEDFSLRAISRKKKGDAGRRFRPENRVLAAPGSFREILRSVASKLGTTITEVPSAGTTQTCSLCGDATPWDHPGEREHRCGACGATYERPWNSACNILAFGTARKAELGVAK